MNKTLTTHVSTAPMPFGPDTVFTQQRVYAGDVLYTENMPAHHMYVVKEGIVDIYMIREEKRVVVESLGAGQCFGMAPHVGKGAKRVNNAAARTYCELYLVSNDVLDADMQKAPTLTTSLLKALSDRLSTAHEIIATRVNYQPEVMVYAQLLHLLGVATWACGDQPGQGRWRRAAAGHCQPSAERGVPASPGPARAFRPAHPHLSVQADQFAPDPGGR